MNVTNDTLKQTASLVNSFLLFATLGMLGFIGHVSWQNSIKLEALTVGQITRTELDGRLDPIKREQDVTTKQLQELRIRVEQISLQLPQHLKSTNEK